MTAQAATVPVATQAPSWRWFAWAALVISLFFVVWDGFNADARLDLMIGLLARALMIFVASAVLVRWRDFAKASVLTKLLVAGLIGLSLDVYWQVAYDSSEPMLRGLAMTLKYAGISAGLACFVALTATFGDGDRHKLRALTAKYVAPGIGIALFITGIAHGAFWLSVCGNTDGICAGVTNPWALGTFRAYLGLDVLARLLIFLAAWTGMIWSSQSGGRLLSVALASTTLTLGTALDFGLRLRLQDTTFANWLLQHYNYRSLLGTLQIEDSIGTLIFALILVIALKTRTLFAMSRYAMYVFSVWLFLLVIGVIEGFSDSWLAPYREALHIDEFWANLFLATTFGLILHRPEEIVLGRIERLRGDIDARIKELRELRTQIGTYTDAKILERAIVDKLTSAARAEFAQIFLRHGKHGYRLDQTSPEQRPCEVKAVGEKELPEKLCRDFNHCELEPAGCLKGAVLALPMPVAGQLYGFLACGPKQCEGEDCYIDHEKEEIASLAREAGGALYALGAHR